MGTHHEGMREIGGALAWASESEGVVHMVRAVEIERKFCVCVRTS
jgi:hypothetical protein